MARKLCYIGRYNPVAYLNDLATLRLRIADIRDRLRAELDPLNNGNDYKVSDIAEWTGFGTFKNFAFVVEERNGSAVPTGVRHLFIFPGNDNASTVSRFQYAFGSNNATICDDYFITTNFNTDFANAAQGAIGIWTNARYTAEAVVTASSTSGSPVASEAIQVQGDPTRTGTLDTINSSTNWTVTQTAGRAFRVGEILEAPGSGATFTINGRTNYTDDMGFNNYGSLSYTGGDFSAPGSSPYSETTLFMPTNAGTTYPQGIVYAKYWGTAQLPCWGVLIFDNDKGFCAMYHTANKSNLINVVGVTGNILKTAKGPGVDDRRDACFAMALRVDADESGFSEGYNIWPIYGDHPAGTGGSRVAASMNIRMHAQFTLDNSPRESDSKYPYELITVDDTNEYKGYLDDELFCNIGAYNDHYGKVFDGAAGPLIKLNQYIAFPWVAGEPIFPPIRWDDEPDDSLLSE